MPYASLPCRQEQISGQLARLLALFISIPYSCPRAGAAAYVATQGVVLAATFAVSHNVPETKPLDDNQTQKNLYTALGTRDWAEQQVLTSANWGGHVGNFFTGARRARAAGHTHSCALPMLRQVELS